MKDRNKMSKVLASYLRNQKEIKRYLYRFFQSPQDIDDITHEAFIKAFATEARTRVRNPKALLFRAAKHAALTELEKRKKKDCEYIEEVSLGNRQPEQAGNNAEAVWDSRRKLSALSVAISELPPMCQKVFMLRKIEGLPIKEIAARLEISVSSVEKHGAEGLVKCNRRMKEFGYDPQEFGAVKKKAADVKNEINTRSESDVKS